MKEVLPTLYCPTSITCGLAVFGDCLMMESEGQRAKRASESEKRVTFAMRKDTVSCISRKNGGRSKDPCISSIGVRS